MATLVSDRYGAGRPGAADGGGALVSALRAGDSDAFEHLYELYRAQIYNLTLRIVQSPEDACDITQEVFIKAFRKLPDSPVTDQHLTPWLYRVAVNASYDHLRTRRIHHDIDDLGADSRAVQVDSFEQADMGRRVEQTLAALSERHRTVLVLKDIHGLRHDEIAEILGISRNAAETLLFRAREAFRVKYLELTEGQPDSHNVEKWSAAGIGLGLFLHQVPLPAALQGGLPFGAAVGGAGAAASGAGTGAAAGTSSGAAAGAAAGGAGGASTGISLAAGGLLAKVGGVATAKIAAVVIAATLATGGGVAAYETGALPGAHHRLPPNAAPAAQAHARSGESSLPGRQGNSAQAPGTAISAAAKARAAAKKAAHDKLKAQKSNGGGKPDQAHSKPETAGQDRAHAKAAVAGNVVGASAESGGTSSKGVTIGTSNGGGKGTGGGSSTSEKPDKPDTGG
jgi:RNA polymerase sigma-70 factor, ECF subfamily